MSLLREHWHRCRRVRDVLAATVGAGFYGTLTLAVIGCSASLSLLR